MSSSSSSPSLPSPYASLLSPWRLLISSWLRVAMFVIVYSTILSSLSVEQSLNCLPGKTFSGFRTPNIPTVTIESSDDVIYQLTVSTPTLFNMVSDSLLNINIIVAAAQDGTIVQCSYSGRINDSTIEVTSCTRDLVVPATYVLNRVLFRNCSDGQLISVTINNGKCSIIIS